MTSAAKKKAAKNRIHHLDRWKKSLTFNVAGEVIREIFPDSTIALEKMNCNRFHAPSDQMECVVVLLWQQGN